MRKPRRLKAYHSSGRSKDLKLKMKKLYPQNSNNYGEWLLPFSTKRWDIILIIGGPTCPSIQLRLIHEARHLLQRVVAMRATPRLPHRIWPFELPVAPGYPAELYTISIQKYIQVALAHTCNSHVSESHTFNPSSREVKTCATQLSKERSIKKTQELTTIWSLRFDRNTGQSQSEDLLT